MANFVKLDDKNIVIGVEVLNDVVITDSDGNEQEQMGVDFLTELYGGGQYKQTSFTGSFRKNYAGIGYSYDETRDAFIPPKPYPSWTLNDDTCQWNAPTAYPDDDKHYTWNEDTKEWDETE